MLRMLDRHAVQESVRAEVTAGETARQPGLFVRTVRRIVREGVVRSGDDVVARTAHQIGRPRVTAAIRARVRALLLEDPERPPGQVCWLPSGRRAKCAGCHRRTRTRTGFTRHASDWRSGRHVQ